MKSLEIKRKEAESRQEVYGNLSAKEKIAKLDKKFGKGLGAKKERIRLQAENKK